MTKYKACCGRRCCLGKCETRKQGGCYCICRLKYAKRSLERLLDGTSYSYKGAIIYEPGRVKTPLGGLERQNRLDELDQVRAKIKEYEIDE